MAQESFHPEDLNISSDITNTQIDGDAVKIFGYTFQRQSQKPTTFSYFNSSQSPPRTPPSQQSKVKNVKKAPVQPVEEEYTPFQTVAWTPPDADALSSVTGDSAVNTVIFQETPPRVPPSEYYKYIPSNLSEFQRCTQLIIWSLRSRLDKDKSGLSSSNEIKTRGMLIARQLKEILMEGLTKGNLEISPFTARTLNNSTRSTRNPINVKNEERLNQLESVIQDLKQESESLDNCSGELSDIMANLIQKKSGVEKTEVSVNEMDEYLEHLDPEQVEFLYNHIESSEAENITFKEPDIDETTMLIQQSSHIVKEFKDRVNSFERDARADLSRRANKRSTIIPEDHEIPNVFESEKETHTNKKIETTAVILRLLSSAKEKNSLDK